MMTTTERVCQQCGASIRGAGVKYCSRRCHTAKRRSQSAATFVDRFWNRVDTSRGEHDCWPWTRATVAGYSVLWWERNNIRASRVAYELTHGEIPAGLFIRHTCDNPPCCNPAHLLPGTVADNSRDMVERNRSASGERSHSRLHPEKLPRGERNTKAKLTEKQVVDIIARHAAGGMNYEQLGREYGVSPLTISRIVRRISWEHVAVRPGKS